MLRRLLSRLARPVAALGPTPGARPQGASDSDVWSALLGERDAVELDLALEAVFADQVKVGRESALAVCEDLIDLQVPVARVVCDRGRSRARVVFESGDVLVFADTNSKQLGRLGLAARRSPAWMTHVDLLARPDVLVVYFWTHLGSMGIRAHILTSES